MVLESVRTSLEVFAIVELNEKPIKGFGIKYDGTFYQVLYYDETYTRFYLNTYHESNVFDSMEEAEAVRRKRVVEKYNL